MKMNIPVTGTTGKGKGFTIIEILVALLIAALTLLLVSNIIVSAIGVQKRSYIRLQMNQKIQSCKSRLLSKPFDAPELQEGHYEKEDLIFIIKLDIHPVTATLKVIHMSVIYKYRYYRITKKTYFYKSKTIYELTPKEVDHD